MQCHQLLPSLLGSPMNLVWGPEAVLQSSPTLVRPIPHAPWMWDSNNIYQENPASYCNGLILLL